MCDRAAPGVELVRCKFIAPKQGGVVTNFLRAPSWSDSAGTPGGKSSRKLRRYVDQGYYLGQAPFRDLELIGELAKFFAISPKTRVAISRFSQNTAVCQGGNPIPTESYQVGTSRADTYSPSPQNLASDRC